MSKALPEPGTYLARRNKPIVVREEESGSLMAYINYTLTDVPYSGMHPQCLMAKDGTIQERTIRNLMKVWPDFDPIDPFSLQDIAFDPEAQDPEFELADCYHEEYTKKGEDGNMVTNLGFRAQWFNPIGGGAPTKEPMSPEDKKAAMARFGGKFKAMFGGSAPKQTTKKAKQQELAPPEEDSKPPKRSAKASGPPSRAKKEERQSSMEEVWTMLVEANPDESEDDLGQKYYGAQDKLFPGKNGDLTSEEWGAVADELGL